MFILRYNDQDETTEMTVSASLKKLKAIVENDGNKVFTDKNTFAPYYVYGKDGLIIGIIGEVQVAS